MSYRFMRVLVFFDLPTLTSSDRRYYRQFRKFLLEEGFIMVQESVYSKLCLNQTGSTSIMNHVKLMKPPAGLVQMLAITEKQFSSMQTITGKMNSDVVTHDQKLVIL